MGDPCRFSECPAQTRDPYDPEHDWNVHLAAFFEEEDDTNGEGGA